MERSKSEFAATCVFKFDRHTDNLFADGRVKQPVSNDNENLTLLHPHWWLGGNHATIANCFRRSSSGVSYQRLFALRSSSLEEAEHTLRWRVLLSEQRVITVDWIGGLKSTLSLTVTVTFWSDLGIVRAPSNRGRSPAVVEGGDASAAAEPNDSESINVDFAEFFDNWLPSGGGAADRGCTLKVGIAGLFVSLFSHFLQAAVRETCFNKNLGTRPPLKGVRMGKKE